MAARVLGQSAPSATTDTDVYTVPSGKTAVLSTIVLCNRGASALTYRVAVRPAGATLANAHYIAYEATLGVSDAHTWTIGVTLGATDVVTVRASSADMSVSVFGDES